jgi:hypothetical protein
MMKAIRVSQAIHAATTFFIGVKTGLASSSYATAEP